jgi:hypothetical protein
MQFPQAVTAIRRDGLAKLDQPGIDAGLQQELGVLVDAVVVHATAGMAAGLVAQVELVVLGHEAQAHHPGLEAGMGCPGAALAAGGPEAGHRHAQRLAGAAAVAVGPVGEHAAAAEAAGDERRVGLGVDQVAGRGHLGAGHPVRQIAARVGRRRVELERRERKLFRMGHGGLSAAGDRT